MGLVSLDLRLACPDSGFDSELACLHFGLGCFDLELDSQFLFEGAY